MADTLRCGECFPVYRKCVCAAAWHSVHFVEQPLKVLIRDGRYVLEAAYFTLWLHGSKRVVQTKAKVTMPLIVSFRNRWPQPHSVFVALE